MQEGKSRLVQAVRAARRKVHADVRALLADETKTYQQFADAVGVSLGNNPARGSNGRHLKASRTAPEVFNRGGVPWRGMREKYPATFSRICCLSVSV